MEIQIQYLYRSHPLVTPNMDILSLYKASKILKHLPISILSAICAGRKTEAQHEVVVVSKVMLHTPGIFTSSSLPTEGNDLALTSIGMPHNLGPFWEGIMQRYCIHD